MKKEEKSRYKRKKLRKIRATVFLLLSMFLLVGFGNKKVELFKGDKANYQLIILKKAIKNADFGKQGNTSAPKKETEVESLHRESDGKETVEQEQVKEEKKETYQITISGESIKFGNTECKTIEDLQKSIEKYCTEGTELSVADDYADSRTYQEVLEVVEEMSKTRKFDVEWE